jgi:hypothetical protein
LHYLSFPVGFSIPTIGKTVRLNSAFESKFQKVESLTSVYSGRLSEIRHHDCSLSPAARTSSENVQKQGLAE